MSIIGEQTTLLFDEVLEDVDESDITIATRYSINSYGADYPVDGLVKRIDNDDILVPTFDPEVVPDGSVDGFQRQFVWSKPQCDRFIESLLLGFPVPGIFLVKQPDGRLLVLDGQQRLRTLQGFYRGVIREKEFALDNVQTHFKRKRYTDLDPEDRRRLDDSIIHATIVKQEEPSDDQSSIYLIFERLNTGGTFLQPQEIRVALYRGGMINLLRDLNSDPNWRALYGARSKRLKDQEQILRFFALLFWRSNYERPMKDFLNRYLSRNREFAMQSAAVLQDVFMPLTAMITRALGERAFKLTRTVNAAVLDSVMVGVGERMRQQAPLTDLDGLRSAYKGLLSDPDYRVAVERATANEESVRERIDLAVRAFSDVS